MTRFGFCAASSLIWGDGGDGGLLFHFKLSKNVTCVAAVPRIFQTIGIVSPSVQRFRVSTTQAIACAHCIKLSRAIIR